ncbi:MAG: GTPase HflX [Chloroflexi bacterium]|nr:GTPase HflX [Chloroflexota bacterium]
MSTGQTKEKAFLVGVEYKGKASGWALESSLEELARLVKTAGAEVVGKMGQKLARQSPSYLGRGKLEQLAAMKESADYTLVVCDDELEPSQQRALEQALQVKVLDRTALILDIFARRAGTREGQLQVELAQHEYLLPRLAGQWSHLERLGGGIGTRGPGESQLETDKRLIKEKISRLKKQLEQVRAQRSLYRKKRRANGIPVVALVGYTNAGKSTLFNMLSRANVTAEDKLFSTLDPVTRRLEPRGMPPFLLTDTVGFIQKLPPSIIAAFRATLEELEEADVLVHVVDITHANAAEQCQTVESTLAGLNLRQKPTVTALNKIDLLQGKPAEEEVVRLSQRLLRPSGRIVLLSAATGFGLDGLLKNIAALLPTGASRRAATPSAQDRYGTAGEYPAAA